MRGDVFRRMIVSGREEYVPGAGGEAEAQLLLRYRTSAATADAYAEAGFTAVVQDVVLGARLETYTGLVRGRPLYVVVLAPSGEAVAAREAGREKTGYGAAWTVPELDDELRTRTPRIGPGCGWTPRSGRWGRRSRRFGREGNARECFDVYSVWDCCCRRGVVAGRSRCQWCRVGCGAVGRRTHFSRTGDR